ncbi:MAG: hypothetical protein Q8T13_21915 [Acidobacteriota bacterium]|nr:hypothetical protein [Acidobacteriota bacterium]
MVNPHRFFDQYSRPSRSVIVFHARSHGRRSRAHPGIGQHLPDPARQLRCGLFSVQLVPRAPRAV